MAASAFPLHTVLLLRVHREGRWGHSSVLALQGVHGVLVLCKYFPHPMVPCPHSSPLTSGLLSVVEYTMIHRKLQSFKKCQGLVVWFSGRILLSMQGPVFSPQYYKKKQLKKNLKLFLFLNLYVWLWLMFCRIHTDKKKEERSIFTCIKYLVLEYW